MGWPQIWGNVPDASPQNFVPADLLKGLLAGHTSARPNGNALASGAERGGGNMVCRCKLARAADGVSSTDSVRRTISGGASAPPNFLKQIGAQRKFETGLSSEDNVLRRRVRSKGEHNEIASLGNNSILVCILNPLRMKSSSMSEDYGKASGCSCCDNARTAGTRDIVSKTHNSAQVIESLNSALKLSDGKSKETARKHSTLGFARLQGEPQMFLANSQHPNVRAESFTLEAAQRHTSHEPKRNPVALLPKASLTSFMKVIKPQRTYPDMRSLNSVQDFLRYTETEGKQFFQELDRDNDGQVTLDDLKVAMDNMKLPPFYAKNFMGRAKTRWLAKSCGWSEFSFAIQGKEPKVLRLFNSLNVSDRGTLQRIHVEDLLRNAGLPATDATATAMMKLLGVDTKGSIHYGHFRKFMLLVPTEQLAVDPWRIWFEAATVGPETSDRAILGSVVSQVASLSRESVITRKKS